jgi:hypothetical protein
VRRCSGKAWCKVHGVPGLNKVIGSAELRLGLAGLNGRGGSGGLLDSNHLLIRSGGSCAKDNLSRLGWR